MDLSATFEGGEDNKRVTLRLDFFGTLKKYLKKIVRSLLEYAAIFSEYIYLFVFRNFEKVFSFGILSLNQ